MAGFGRIAAALERRLYADSRARGVSFILILVGSASGAGVIGQRCSRRHTTMRTALLAAVTWAVLGGQSLRTEALAVLRLVHQGDLPAARQRLTHLVGRDTSTLEPDEIVRAVVESVAENTSDAVVAPLLAGAVFGVPGLLGYRAANTLDAMVGHHSARYERFGWASARLDDLLNLAPARCTGLLVGLFAPLVGGKPIDAARAWARDAAAHPSPNAGVVESSFAGALGVTLGGRNFYQGRVEQRPGLGTGRAPAKADIVRSVKLADVVGWAALAAAILLARAPKQRQTLRH